MNNSDSSSYDTTKLINEILNESADSPKLFVINLPEADVARYFCAEIIDRIFRKRKSSFTLTPRIVFVSSMKHRNLFLPTREKKMERIVQVVL